MGTLDVSASAKCRVLVVSGDPRTDGLCRRLRAGGLQTKSALPHEAQTLTCAWQPEVVLVDASLARPTRGVLLDAIRCEASSLLALLIEPGMTAGILEALHANADAVVSWDAQPGALLNLIPTTDRIAAKQADCASVLPPLVVGNSPTIQEVWRLVFLAAPKDASILVTGDTGVGKEVIARALHRFSPRRHGPFVAVNCAALPEGLLESELFGHEKGAFTGATNRRPGRFELANGGTLFLDEIGELPGLLQVKLLRVLQERVFERVGGTNPISVDVRVVAATNRDLEQECNEGRFRHDLYYRLNALTIRVPALRDRQTDILTLWNYFLQEAALREGRQAPGTTTEAQRLLLKHSWPGNVRELQNAVQHALTLCTGDSIVPEHLPARVHSAPIISSGDLMVGMTIAEAERALIIKTYESLDNVASTAEMLGISPRKLQYRLKSYRDSGFLAPSPRQLAVGRSSADPDAGKQRLRVLLAEDDHELRRALAELLAQGGFDVTPVADGQAVLDQLLGGVGSPHDAPRPDVLIADVRMPRVTGLQLLKEARHAESSVPVIMMSAFGDDSLRRTARDLGAAAFLDKPVDIAELERVIRRTVQHGAHSPVRQEMIIPS